MKLSILIPTFNEEPTIERVIRRIHSTRFPIAYELVVVDDHSGDRTFAIEQRLRAAFRDIPIRLLRNRVNKGKGACVRQGLKHATGDWVVIQDGDLELDPRQIPTLLEPVLEGRAEVVFGSRFLNRRWPRRMSWPSYLANRLLTGLTNCLYGVRLTDMETCYKLMSRQLWRGVRLRASRFDMEPEVAAKVARRGVRIVEVPISYRGRTRHQGKKIRARDFFTAAWTLLRYRFWRMRG